MKTRAMIRLTFAAMALACLATSALAAPSTAAAQPVAVERAGLFPMQDGKAIYEGVCQGCHMPGGKGAAGAGAYPALAANPRLEGSAYPAVFIINGQGAMPPFGQLLDDRQIVEVVNYIRTNFGNRYKDKITAAEVKAMR